MTADDLRTIARRVHGYFPDLHSGGYDLVRQYAQEVSVLLVFVRRVADRDPLIYFDDHRGCGYECYHCDGKPVDVERRDGFEHLDSCLWLIAQGAKS